MTARALLFLGALLLAASPAAQGGESAIIRFRLLDEPDFVYNGWVYSITEEGFSFERFGSNRRRRYRWSDLVEADANRLRRRFKLDPDSKDATGRLDGVRIHFKGGHQVEGVLDRVDLRGRYWVRSGGLLLPYPADRIERVEEIAVREKDVFDERQLYLRRLERHPPRDAHGHRALADYAYDVGEFARAKQHYEAALKLEPNWRPAIAGRLAEIEEYLKDEWIAKQLRIVKRAMRVEQDFDRARERLDALLSKYPGKRALVRMQDEYERERHAWLAQRFHAVKNQEFARAIHEYLGHHDPDIDEAMSWARSKLPAVLMERVREQLGLSDEELEEFAGSNARGAPHWAGYWSGSFVVSRRAKRGKSSAREVRGDPDRWWSTYPETRTRGNFLRAYAAEKLPDLFEVVQIKLRPCERCGGSGRLKHGSLRGLKALGGGHDWHQTCPRCFAACVDRVVAYR